tara:strand:- start:151 stop:408 length:258 start_codon:yes stop_codon:yes gene_type:complete
MYAYIEAEFEGESEGAVEEYRKLTELVRVQPIQPAGIPENEYRALYDQVARGVPVQGDPGIIEMLSPMQRYALNEVKKFVKRNTK